MALFSEGGGSFPDVVIVIYLLTFCLISIVVNPVVFIYNLRQRKSVPQFLFRLLAAVDFLTCLFLPVMVSINVTKHYEITCREVNNETKCSQPPYLEEHGPVTFSEQMLGIITWTLLITPPMITALLTTSRYHQTRYPLRHIHLPYIILFLLLYLAYVVTFLSCLFFHPNTRYYSRIQSVWSIFNGLGLLGTVLMFTGPCICCQVLSVLCSLLTVWELFKSIKDPTAIQLRKHGRNCSIKILITNLGSIIFMIFYLAMLSIAYKLQERTKTDCILYFMYSVVMPVFLSVFNPVIFVLFTPKTFKVAWEKLRNQRNVPSRAQSFNFGPPPYALPSRPSRPDISSTASSYPESKVYHISDTSTVIGVKRVSELEIQNMVYSNFHTIRKETENAIERVQSPIVFDLSEGGDRQRRVSRFRSMEQQGDLPLLSPSSAGDDACSVFSAATSRSESMHVTKRPSKSEPRRESKNEKRKGSVAKRPNKMDTKSFPNVSVVHKSDTITVLERSREFSDSEDEMTIDATRQDDHHGDDSNDGDRSKSETEMSEAEPGRMNPSDDPEQSPRSRISSFGVAGLVIDKDVGPKIQVIAELVSPPRAPRKADSLFDILSNSDNMSNMSATSADIEWVQNAERSKQNNVLAGNEAVGRRPPSESNA